MLKAENIKKTYNAGKKIALQDFSIEVPTASIYGLLGPNGAGKTSFIRIINQITQADEGNVWIDGEKLNPEHIKNIGYMPQIGRYPENMTIGHTIQMIKDTRKVSEEHLDTELLEDFELEKMYDKKMGNLSGGTTQKVSAVLAFMFDPKIIILDEPTAGLDPLASEILKKKIIKEKNKGKLIIITSHLLSELDDIVSEIIFMNEGKILVHQSVEDLLHQTNSEKISESIVTILKEMKK